MSCRKPTHLPPCDNTNEYEKVNKSGITCCYKKPNQKKSVLKPNKQSNTKTAKTNNEFVSSKVCNPKFPSNDIVQNYKQIISFDSSTDAKETDIERFKRLSDSLKTDIQPLYGEKWLSFSNYINSDRFDKKYFEKLETILNRDLKIKTPTKGKTTEKVEMPEKEKTTEKTKTPEKGKSRKLPNLSLIKTERFNKFKGFYTSTNECLKIHKEKDPPITNKKFQKLPHKFDQLYFHAGDWEDIERYAILPVRLMKPKLHKQIGTAPISKIYQNYTTTSIITTLKYCFYHLKKAIFVVIRNNELVTFLPFSNADYQNPFSKYLYFNEEDKKNQSKYVPAKGINKKFIDEFKKDNDITHSIELNRKKWQINNCNIRYFGKGNAEGEHGTNVYKDMLDELCSSKNIPDCEFIINPRDFPYMRLDKKHKLLEPYEHLFPKDPPSIPGKYKNNSYLPILSTCSTSEFADVMIPSVDDWKLATKKIYWDWKLQCPSAPEEAKLIPWSKRQAKVVFRGSATGCGITTETNVRLKAAEIAMEHPDILDVVLVDANKRPKKYKGKPIQIIDESYLTTKNIKIDKDAKMSDEEQYKFKFILHLDGHAAAFRLGRELRSGSAILIPKSKYKVWFSHKLVPYEHFVPVKEDLSDLVKQVNWCLKNDSKCKQIGENAQKFHKEFLTEKNLLKELEFTVKDIAHCRSQNKFMDVIQSKIGDMSKSVAIITIFRAKGKDAEERMKQKEHFIEIVPKLFKLDNINFEIFLIEQSDDKQKFNIGKLKNIGFELASKNSFDHYIFTDIDVYPDSSLQESYLTKPKNDGVVSLAMKGTRYTQDKAVIPFLGACLKFSGKVFQDINGFPNNFWGWGREDHVIANRLKELDMTLYYPEKGSLIDLEELKGEKISAQDKKHILDNEVEKTAYEKENTMDHDNGLKTLNYKILKYHKNENINNYLVDLMFKDDMNNHPQWFPKNDQNSTKKPIAKLKIQTI